MVKFMVDDDKIQEAYNKTLREIDAILKSDPSKGFSPTEIRDKGGKPLYDTVYAERVSTNTSPDRMDLLANHINARAWVLVKNGYAKDLNGVEAPKFGNFQTTSKPFSSIKAKSPKKKKEEQEAQPIATEVKIQPPSSKYTLATLRSGDVWKGDKDYNTLAEAQATAKSLERTGLGVKITNESGSVVYSSAPAILTDEEQAMQASKYPDKLEAKHITDDLINEAFNYNFAAKGYMPGHSGTVKLNNVEIALFLIGSSRYVNLRERVLWYIKGKDSMENQMLIDDIIIKFTARFGLTTSEAQEKIRMTVSAITHKTLTLDASRIAVASLNAEDYAQMEKTIISNYNGKIDATNKAVILEGMKIFTGNKNFTEPKATAKTTVAPKIPIGGELPGGKKAEAKAEATKTEKKTDIGGFVIDPRIDVSDYPDIQEKISKNLLNAQEEEFVRELNVINKPGRIDELLKILESKDFELTRPQILFERNKKLSLNDWGHVYAHSKAGTTIPMHEQNITSFGDLKYVINRIDSVTNERDRDNLIDIYYRLTDPGTNKTPLVHDLETIIKKYKDSLKGVKVQVVDKTEMRKKIGILRTAIDPRDDENLAILENMEMMLVADKILPVHEMMIDQLIREYANLLKDTTLDFGETKNSRIKFVTQEEARNSRIKKVADGINLYNADEIAATLAQLHTLPDESAQRMYNQIISGESLTIDDDKIDEAIIIMYHADLVDPNVLSYILEKISEISEQ